MTSTTSSKPANRWSAILLVTALVLGALPAHTEAQSLDDLRVIVPGTMDEIHRLVERYGLDVRRQLSHGGVLEVTPEQLEALRRDNTVGHISADAIVESTMAVATTAVGADQAWEGLAGIGSVTGQGVGIAILDSGIAAHPDLGNRVVVDIDFVDSSGSGDDGYGHGTHVAGIAAGRAANGSQQAGIAPGAHLINLRVLNDEGWGHASTVIAAIDWAIANKDQYGPDPLSWTLTPCGRRSPRCQEPESRIRRSFASSWSRWSGPDVPPRTSPASLNRRPSRSVTGWLRPIAMPGVGPMVSRPPSVPN